MKRIKEVIILKQIVFENNHPFPLSTKIIIDRKNIVKKKSHQIVYQQGSYYGTIGDRCAYISHEQLFQLEKEGIIKLI